MTEEMWEGGESLVSLPTLRHIMSTDWRAHARCATMPKTPFFDYNIPTLKRDERQERKQMALDACACCPVADECYEFSVLNCEPFGIWAGIFPEERKKLYKEFLTTGTLRSRTGS